MKLIIKSTISFFSVILLLYGCKSFNGLQTATALGATGGETFGEIVGKASGNASAGAAIGANIGEVTGTVMGSKMDKQAVEIKNEVSDAKVNRVGEGIVVEFNSKILFQSNHSDLTPIAKKNLDGLIAVIKKYPENFLEIKGHTDNKGADARNKLLSKERAGSVATYLETRGINSSRIVIKGLGDSFPKYGNDSASGRMQNRRVEVFISSPK